MSTKKIISNHDKAHETTEQHIERALTGVPPMSDEQCSRIARILGRA